MRFVHLLGGVLGVGVLAGAAGAAETPAEEKVIRAAEVEVRSGPSASPAFYSTGKLHRGDKVQVLRDRSPQAGWVAIKPPPGSFSWVNARLVLPIDEHTAKVVAEDTPVLIGSALINRPPSVRSPKPLARGTIVYLLDKPLRASDDSKWYPIEPNPTEVRFIPASAIESEPAVATVSAKEPPANVQDPTFLQAETAEKAGNFAEADRLYRQVQARTADQNLKVLCANRLAGLKSGPGPGAPRVALGQPQTPANQATALYGTTQWNSPGNAAAGRGVASPEQWSGPGWLARAEFQIDGKPVYRLMDRDRQLVLYIIPQPGLSLDPHVNRWVNLYGPVTYRSEAVRAYFMMARWVQPQ